MMSGMNPIDEKLRELEETARLNLPIPSDEWRRETFLKLTKLCQRYREVLRGISKSCDSGYLTADWSSKIVTIDRDDFYDCCGFPRDCADIELKMKWEEL